MAGSSKRKTLKAAVVGAGGYTGGELLRILFGHPKVDVTACTSDSLLGQGVGEAFPALREAAGGLKFRSHADAAEGKIDADVYFLALPHGAAHPFIPVLLERGKVIDLSADYRLKKAADYKTWYGSAHPAPKVLAQAVFGLPELRRAEIKKAKLIANPGCYPTSVILALAPLAGMKKDVEPFAVVDSKSGYSGAGRNLKPLYLFAEGFGDFKAYNPTAHRHIPEMLQEVRAQCGRGWDLTFTPHLLPTARGILSSICVRLKRDAGEAGVREMYEKFYKNEPFVRVLGAGEMPSIKQVCGTNMCAMNVFVDGRSKTLKIISVIDNLVKGASGQAVQNMNLMFGMLETEGLERLAATP